MSNVTTFKSMGQRVKRATKQSVMVVMAKTRNINKMNTHCKCYGNGGVFRSYVQIRKTVLAIKIPKFLNPF
jgi:hypothetical protein